ncbi:uncharacterized protein LOC116843417 [Odontomachus brunneus]|uniref:uncharacterized protein LOC116843417 n=1 Tax=Odontomachus brunneus TaxID=486640 RepID=UPI0013F29C0C|nr:uncharacterized protein LOC116843417 [Odontomachus brunneus]
MSGLKRLTNNESKKNNDYSLQLSRWFLISIGAWPQTRTSSIMEKFSSIILVPILSSAVAIIITPCLLYVFLEARDMQTKLSPLLPLIHRIIGSLNYWILLTHGKAIHECIKHMEKDWHVEKTIEDTEVMMKHAKIGRYMTAVCAIFMQGSALLFNIFTTMKTVTFINNNVTTRIHPLSCPAYRKLLDARFSPANEIMISMQFISSYLTNSSTVCICSLAIVFAMHACGQLNMLSAWFNEFDKDYGKKNYLAERRLTAIVKHHLRVLCFIGRIESIMYKACFVELMGCTLNMCLIGYYLVMNWSTFSTAKLMSLITVYISMAFNIFIFCYVGEIITEQCKNVGRMAYMTNWYKLNYKTARGFILIIARSNNVIKITAGKLFDLSIATFGDIIKTSLAYMNVLQTISYIVHLHEAIMSGFTRVPSDIKSKKNNDYSLQFSRWFLLSIGAWPQTRTSSIIERLSSLILVPIWWSIVAVISIPCLLYILFEAKGIQMKLNSLGALVHRIMGSWNYWVLLTHSKAIHECIKHMEKDWHVAQRIEDYEVMMKHAKIGRYMAGACAIFMQISSILFNIYSTMKTVTFIHNNVTVTTRPLSCPAYRKLIDARFSPANEIMISMQFISSFIMNSSTVCICSLAIVFAMHACGQLNMLSAWFNEFVEDYAKENYLAQRKLTTIVEHHLRVLCFIGRMENIMYKACFVELMGCTLNMCLVGYYFVMNWSVFSTGKIMSLITIYISMAFNIFIFCYIGEIITEQCRNVGRMVYMTNWYKLNYKTARAIILIIARSNNVIKITAGKIFHLSIATFGDIIKTSLAYINVLQTMSV